MFLTAAGQIYACGFGGYGRLGMKDTKDRPVPVLVESLAHVPVCHVSAGQDHSVAIDTEGGIYWWGRNGFKSDGTRTPQSVDVLGRQFVASATASKGFTLAISEGKAWVWGQAGYKETVGLRSSEGAFINPPKEVPHMGHLSVVSLAASEHHCVAVVRCETSVAGAPCLSCDGVEGELVTCSACSMAAHPSCLRAQDRPSAEDNSETSSWTCPQCTSNLSLGPPGGKGEFGCFAAVVDTVEYLAPTEFGLTGTPESGGGLSLEKVVSRAWAASMDGELAAGRAETHVLRQKYESKRAKVSR
jgi:hypothetical protein